MMEMKITVEAPDLAASILKLAEAIASGPDPSIFTPAGGQLSHRPGTGPCARSCGPCEPCAGHPYPDPYPCACGPCGGPQPRSCADCWPDICRPW